jgi:transposase-like protein
MKTQKLEGARAQTRRRYDENYKQHAVELTLVAGPTVPVVGQELGINENMLYRWRRRYGPPRGVGMARRARWRPTRLRTGGCAPRWCGCSNGN